MKYCPRCDQHEFASIIMTIYYMAMRTRPDLQVYCAFLASRIHECNTFDMKKVYHLLSYIKHTKYRSIILRSKGTRLHFSTDASVFSYSTLFESLHIFIQKTKGHKALTNAYISHLRTI